MAIYQQKVNEEQSFLESFASLEWLDGIISFGFRLLAKLAEPFLAAGLIMSAIDYMSHGTFLVGLARSWWIVTQGFALESSGGVVLALSFEARSEGDKAKMWLQLVLGLALLIVGGVLFFVEMAAAVKGFNESTMPDLYIYGMAALRSVVSLGYIAVMRTKHHRFSGTAQSTVPTAQPDPQQIVDDMAAQLRTQLRNELIGLRNEFAQLRSVHQETQGRFETAQRTMVAEVRSEIAQLRSAHQEIQCQLETAQTQLLEAAQRTTVTEVRTEQTTVRSRRALRKIDTEPEICAIVADQSEDMEARIHRYILEVQTAQGRIPTLSEIQEHCACAKNTAVEYRRSLLNASAQ